MYCCPHCAHTRITVLQSYRCLMELRSDPQDRAKIESHVVYSQGFDVTPDAVTTCMRCQRPSTIEACKSAYTLHFGIFQDEPDTAVDSAPAEPEGEAYGGTPDHAGIS